MTQMPVPERPAASEARKEQAGMLPASEAPLKAPLSFGATVRRNVSVTLLARIGYMITRVMIPPFVLARIGLDAYGIWTMVFILVSYFGTSTLGISNVYIKYVAEFNARREYDRINSLLSTGLAVTVPLCSILFAAFYCGWPWFAPLLRLPPSHATDGREAVLIVIGVFLSSISLNAFGDALTGMQEIAATQWFWTVGYLVEFAAVFTLVGMGRGVRGLAEAYLLRIVVNDGLSIWWAWRRLPWLRISPRLIRREVIGWVVHFGGLVQLQSMLSILLSSIEKVIALFTVNLAATGLFEIAKKWPASVQTLPMAFFGAFLPASSHLEAHATESEKRAVLRSFYLRGSRYANFCTAYFCALMTAIAGPILTVWLGAKQEYMGLLTVLFIYFTLAMQMHMLTGPGTSILRGMGRVYDEFFYSVPNVILLLLLVPAARWITGSWSPAGIGAAVACATAGSALVLLGRVQRVLDFGFVSFAREVLMPSLVFYAAAFTLKIPVTIAIAHAGRWSGAAVLLGAGLLYTAVSTMLLYWLVLRPEERCLLREQLGRVSAALSRKAVGSTDASRAEVAV